jgi:hypothetical protein
MIRSIIQYRSTRWLLICSALTLLVAPCWAQVGDRRFSDDNLTDAERRETTLLWLDSFLTESNLLRQEDISKIREAVSQMSPSQLREWLEQTKQLREYVESEQWQETKQWLREFLRVQAVYSDEELQKLRDEIVQADADQMLAILKRIQAKHDALVWMHQAAQRNRQVEVAERDAHVAQQSAAADAARASAAAVGGPLYGGGAAGGGARRPSVGYTVPRPLIDSREMSRAAVWSELWGPGFILGF